MPSADDLRRSTVSEAIRRARLVVVLRRVEPVERLRALAVGLAEAGVRIFEVTMDGAEAPRAIEALRAALPDAGSDACVVGAGTIRSTEQLGAASDAGASFGMSPVLDEAVLSGALGAGLPFAPGAYTPTEVERAWRAGATFVKLFPASSLGSSHLRELRGPLGEIALIPTGGIDASTAGEYLAAGAVAVGIGSAIVGADADGRRRIVDAVMRA